MDGILLFNKPILWTSHDAVDFVRRRLRQTSVGHAGTLDPMATGLLVMLVGKATKWSQELTGLDKVYRGAMELGVTTDTQDMEGRILSFKRYESASQGRVEKVFLDLEGPQSQTPPAFSAVHKEGKRLYEWARQGKTFTVEPRQIKISRFHVERFSPPEIHFSLQCSKGTYVRALCDVVGEKLGTGAALSCLVRTRIGDMELAGALDQRDLQKLSAAEIQSRLLQKTVLGSPAK